jgi:branched-subunit amino acid ABC-type transport system permease component
MAQVFVNGLISDGTIALLALGFAVVFLSITVNRAQFFAVAVSSLILTMFYCWLRFSNLGLQFRASTENSIQLAFFGHNIRRLRFLAFGMAGMLVTASPGFL